MKRLLVCLIAVALTFAAGCAGPRGGAVSADVGVLADGIVKSAGFKDKMSPIAQKTADKIYGLNAADVAKAKVYESTGATAEEVAVFEAKDENAASAVGKAVSTRVEDQKSAFQGYQPKEMAKLKNPLIVKKGTYVVLVVADDTSAAKAVVQKYLG